MDSTTAAAIAQQLLQARQSASPIERPSQKHSITLQDGYQIAAELARGKLQAGDTVRGAKLGFTTPAVWPAVGLTGPLWAPVFESTYTEAELVALHPMRAPEVEPEVVFGFRSNASPQGDVASMIEWWALGLEVVDTGYPPGPPVVADQAADMCAHQKLIVGPKRPFEPSHAALLAEFTSSFSRDGQVQSEGKGSSVMGSPLLAAEWFVRNLLGTIPWPREGGVLTTGRLSAPPLVPLGRSEWELTSTLPLPALRVTMVRA